MRDRDMDGMDRFLFRMLILIILPAPILACAGMDSFDVVFSAPILAIIEAVLWMIVCCLVGVTIEFCQRKPLTIRQGEWVWLASGVISLVLTLILVTADGNPKPGPRSSIELDVQTKLASRAVSTQFV